MGVLVFAMAVSTVTDKNAMHLMRAEVPGPLVSKIVPRGTRNAKILYGIYMGLCLIEFLMLLFGGMSPYDSLIHTFSTARTGGFSSKNASVGAFESSYIEWVITVFMFLFSLNFNLYYFMLVGKLASVYKNSEWKVFTAIVVAAAAAITVSIRHLYPTLGEAVRAASFQTVSVISTTGFITADFELWGGFAKSILITLMFVGACSGSTGGGIKVARLIILGKLATKSVSSMLRPRQVVNIKVDGKPIGDEVARTVSGYLVLYVLVLVASLLIVAANGMSFEESFSSVMTCFNNVGPGFGSVGPTGNFYVLSGVTKLVLSFDMLLGRLEIFPILLLFVPSIWNRRFI